MEAHGTGWLHASLVYLAAAVAAVPLARALGLGSVIGYLVAGIAIGPWGLALVQDPQQILRFAEFGVVLMLFLVGLELEPRRLWALRGPIFGWGTLQLLASSALIAAAGVAFGFDWRVATVAGLALAMSSTAIGLAVLAERNLSATTGGRGVLSVSLLQDVSAIPILAGIPLLAVGAAAGGGGGWTGAAKAAAVIAGIVLGGRLLLRPALRWIARSRTPEVFTAASLLLVVATAALMESVGLSMALGAFLAGVLLAESEYRRELETDLEPFKGLLLGLFFIAVGMSIDFAVVLAAPALIAGVVVAFLLLKTAVLVVMARAMPVPVAERPAFVILLAQGGEFGFVVLQAAGGAAVIDAATGSRLVAAIAISMLLTPLALLAADRWSARRGSAAPPAGSELSEPQQAPVLIAGYGRYGQIVGRLINACGHRATVLDHSAETIETVRRFGWQAFYGDATRLDLLRRAGAAEARVFVLAIDDPEQSVACAQLVREHFPQLVVVARARNVSHFVRLREAGVTLIERETLDAALTSARSVLEALGMEPHAARQASLRFRAHTIELIEQMVPHLGDESQLVAIAREGRDQLERMWAAERAEQPAARARQGWTARGVAEDGD